MDKRLHRLETIDARGTDGKHYVVHGYEHLVRLEGNTDRVDQWEPTGEGEYKLADGRRVEVDADGGMKIASTDIRLAREDAARAH